MKFSLMMQTSSKEEMDRIKLQMLEKAKKVLYLSMVKMESLAINYCPVNTGMLRSSIHLTPNSSGSTEYVLADGVEYGVYVEYGTAPHVPPIEPLKDWSKKVLGDENAAWAVRAKIMQHGTKSQPFFRPALHEVNTIWFPQYKKSIFA